MSHAPFTTTLPMPNAGLASRRGQGQGIKPLTFDGVKAQNNLDNGVPTPRTSRSHLLAGLRTAPKTATGASFNNGPASPTVIAPPQGARNRNSMIPGMYDNTNMYNGPKTSVPRYNGTQQQMQQQQQQQQQQLPQASAYNLATGYSQQQYTADQILAPPQLQLDGVEAEQLDPYQAQLMYNSAYLRNEQERLQNQIRLLQQAAQQFQGLNINGQAQMMQPTYSSVYQQQVQNMVTPTAQGNVYVGYDQATGQQMFFMDQSQAQLQAQLNNQYIVNQNQAQLYAALQQQQQQLQLQQAAAPRVQVSPPPEARNNFRSTTPPRRQDSPPDNTVPLPPPSANAFRRGHKKSPSLANNNNTSNKSSLTISTSDESPKSGALKTSTVPLTPLTSGYGPGQARAGEHPVRQPRNPPSLDELKSKPTAKHDGSKNFVTRTRRSAVTNLVRAGLERRKEARSTGSISPISESTEEMIETPMTDNDSDSGRSGSGSLIERDDAESSLPSSRTSTGSWGAIGSDRPSSRQKLDRRNPDSATSSDNEGARESGSFASLLKNSSRRAKADSIDGPRKGSMLVLTSAKERKLAA
ncbi:hypothetical protein QBC38DRAFT_457131 [Podospora fimiseda]|uniref:Uncharacterized protein n=1 Tax=Podospora fimiseda TaxID=252190 RepID=A0AAN7H1A2_9PEZI|nr:hypothetical protein QBC38DRAFT_457131 [Podospora fimiseda]